MFLLIIRMVRIPYRESSRRRRTKVKNKGSQGGGRRLIGGLRLKIKGVNGRWTKVKNRRRTKVKNKGGQ